MPLCPQCHNEYETDTDHCPRCGVEPVSTSPGSESRANTNDADRALVELAAFPLSSEAEMIQELLESNGIRTILRGDMDPIGAVSGATPSTLLIERGDLPRAREIYEEYFAGDPVATDVAENEDDQEPEEDEPA